MNHNDFIVVDSSPLLSLKNSILMYAKDFAWKEKKPNFPNCKKTILEISCIRSIWFILLVHDQVFVAWKNRGKKKKQWATKAKHHD
jgi:hypothetical protein